MSAPSRPAVLSAELRVAIMRSARRLRAQKSDDGVSDSQYSVLGVLLRHGPLSANALAEHERVQPPSMTRTLTALVAAGLVTRADDPLDGRRVLIALSERGAGVVRETRRQRDAWLARRLAALTSDERAVLTTASELLLRIADS